MCGGGGGCNSIRKKTKYIKKIKYSKKGNMEKKTNIAKKKHAYNKDVFSNILKICSPSNIKWSVLMIISKKREKNEWMKKMWECLQQTFNILLCGLIVNQNVVSDLKSIR